MPCLHFADFHLLPYSFSLLSNTFTSPSGLCPDLMITVQSRAFLTSVLMSMETYYPRYSISKSRRLLRYLVVHQILAAEAQQRLLHLSFRVSAKGNQAQASQALRRISATIPASKHSLLVNSITTSAFLAAISSVFPSLFAFPSSSAYVSRIS